MSIEAGDGATISNHKTESPRWGGQSRGEAEIPGKEATCHMSFTSSHHNTFLLFCLSWHHLLIAICIDVISHYRLWAFCRQGRGQILVLHSLHCLVLGLAYNRHTKLSAEWMSKRMSGWWMIYYREVCASLPLAKDGILGASIKTVTAMD